jgi:non-homologous end joining protein Ku
MKKPYFVIPENDSVEALQSFHKARQRTGKLAIGKIA